MKPELEERALSIVLQLTDLHVNDRHKLQRQLCGDDIQLLHAVDELFRVYENANGMDFWLGASKARFNFSGADCSQNDDVVFTDQKDQNRIRRPPTLDRFIPIDLLGLGGQGEVWLMKDPRIDRRVALKIVQPSKKDSRATLTSFRREAELNGKLEHPNIVPVYDITAELNESGEPDSKSPCFVMRVFGDPRLHAAISAFHERPRSDSEQELLVALRAFDKQQSAETRSELEHQLAKVTFDSSQASDQTLKSAVESILKDDSEAGTLTKAIAKLHAREWSESNFRKLLGRFQRICEGVAYAHSRGVIHRDLKPDNIMLGEYGETLVADWGLAKIVGRQDEVHPENVEGTLRVSSDSADSPHTRRGELKGTPRYMSPEQAMGRIDELGPATDIYSLGAILYCILTGKPPIEGKTFEEILSRVRAGKFARPTEVQPRVPKGLEAVVLKAISLKPRDRYATALDLAGDVEHWLNDERILAWDEPWVVRGRRWIRHHQTLVTSTAAAMFVGTISLGILSTIVTANSRAISFSNKQLEKSNALLEQEKTNVEKQREVAEENAKIAETNAEESEKNAIIARQSEERERHLRIAARDQAVQRNLVLGEEYARAGDLLAANMANSIAFASASDFFQNTTDISRPHPIPDHESRIHRLRIGIAGSLAPQLQNVLFAESPITLAEFSRSGTTIATLQTLKGTINLFDAKLGVPVGSPLSHRGRVRALALSPDGLRLASCAINFEEVPIIYLWDTTSGQQIAEASTRGRIKKLIFDHDGSQLATASVDGILGESGLLQIWDGKTLKAKGDAKTLDASIGSIAFSPDGERIAAAVPNNRSQVVIYQTTDGKLICQGGELSQHPPEDICFSPDGTKVGIASNTGAAQVIDAETGASITPLLMHEEQMEGAFDVYGRALCFIKFSPDSKRVLTACGDRTARLWDAEKGIPVGLIMSHRDAITSCQFSPDGSRIGTSCMDGTARLWDAVSGRPISSPLWHFGPIHSLRFSPDGERILTGSDDRTARVWSISSPRPWNPGGPDNTNALLQSAVSGNGRWLAGEIKDQFFQVWNSETRIPVGASISCAHPAHLIRFASEKTWLTLAGLVDKTNGQVSIVDFVTGKAVNETVAVKGAPIQVVFSPDDRWCAILGTSAKGTTLTIQDTQDHKTITLEVTDPMQFVWHPVDPSQLFIAGRNGLIYQTSLPGGEVVATEFEFKGQTIRQLGISRDGQLLTTASSEGVHVWSTNDKRLLFPTAENGRKDKTRESNGALFSHDNSRLLTWGNDRHVRVWNRELTQNRWQEAGQLAHSRDVNDATFSPDGLLIASASDDGTARVWDARTLEPVSPPLEHTTTNLGFESVKHLRFRPDGQTLFAATQNIIRQTQVLPPKNAFRLHNASPLAAETMLKQLTETVTGVWEWRLPTCDADVETVLKQTQFLSGKKFDTNGRLQPLSPQDQLAFLEMIASTQPNGWTARQQLARLAVERDDLIVADEQYDKAVEQEQSNGQLWFESASVAYNLDNFKKAWNAADRAISCGLIDSKTWLVRGRASRQLGRFNEAIFDFKKATETSNVPFLSRLDLANCQAMLGQFDDAAASFDQSFDEHGKFDQLVSPAHRYDRIVLELARNRPDEYKKLTSQFLRQNQRTSDAYTAYLVVLCAVLNQDSVTDWSPIIALGESVAVKDPELSERQAAFGFALFRTGKIEEAERQIRKAIRLQKPEDSKTPAPSALPHYFLAMTLNLQGKTGEALESLATANKFFKSLEVRPEEISLIDRLPWQRRAIFEILRQEAEGNITLPK